jgi:hypothetical protein
MTRMTPLYRSRLYRATRAAGPLVTSLALALFLLAAPNIARAGCEGTWGVSVSYPQVVSASAGLLVGEIEPRQPPPKGSTFLPKGLLLQAEPGLGGGKLAVGYAKGLLPYAAGGVKATVLRTWGHPWGVPTGKTYLGVEADASFFVRLSLGALWRTGDHDGSSRFLLTGGLGLGF